MTRYSIEGVAVLGGFSALLLVLFLMVFLIKIGADKKIKEIFKMNIKRFKGKLIVAWVLNFIAFTVCLWVVEYALHQNYPNPFNPTTTVRFDLPEAAEVHLVVYDLLGREVIQLVNEALEPGYRQVTWNGRTANGGEVPTGIYIARLVTPEFSRSIKMLLLK